LNIFHEYLIQHSLKSGGTKEHFRGVKVPGTTPYWKACWNVGNSFWCYFGDINDFCMVWLITSNMHAFWCIISENRFLAMTKGSVQLPKGLNFKCLIIGLGAK